MEELASGRASENIFYAKHEEVNLTELAPIYQDNMETLYLLAEQLGTVSPIMEGEYGSFQAYDES
jgi:hypothetical protein